MFARITIASRHDSRDPPDPGHERLGSKICPSGYPSEGAHDKLEESLPISMEGLSSHNTRSPEILRETPGCDLDVQDVIAMQGG